MWCDNKSLAKWSDCCLFLSVKYNPLPNASYLIVLSTPYFAVYNRSELSITPIIKEHTSKSWDINTALITHFKLNIQG